MNETELLFAVVDLLDEVTWVRRASGELAWHHCIDSRDCIGTRGLPDLIIIGEHGIIFAELKTEYADLNAHQDFWAWILSHHGQVVYALWRPSDLASGRIRRELEEIR